MGMRWMMRPIAGATLMLGGGLSLGIAAQLPAQAGVSSCGESSAVVGSNTVVTFTASCGGWTIPDGVTSLDVLAVGGGGGGGGADVTSPDGGGGGGGGGSVVTQTVTVAPGQSAAISVGGGGTGAASPNVDGGNGGSSQFSVASSSVSVVADGGTGGQGSQGTPTPQGFNYAGVGGDSGTHVGGPNSFDGAGGGAGDSGNGSTGVDIPNISANGGDGGPGTTESTTGTAVEYGCGGGGGGTMGGSYAFPPYGQLFDTSGVPLIAGTVLSSLASDTAGHGGCANAGDSSLMDGSATGATGGVANTGGGGGGGSITGCSQAGVLVACSNYLTLLHGASGGSGIVAISYATPEVTTTTTVPPTTTPTTEVPTTVAAAAPTSTSTNLAYTGAEVGGMALLGVMLLTAGSAIVIVARRRSASTRG